LEPHSGSVTLEQDSGLVYIDTNGALAPESPLAPLVAAVIKTDSGFDFQKMDVITDRNNLRKLLDLIELTHKDFMILVELVGDSLFLTRTEQVSQKK
jgi:hypothetical protein